jgi:hypothetical protein
MPEPAYYDELGRPVYDRTAQYRDRYGPDPIKVEQCERNVLCLFRERDHYVLLYRWLSHDTDMSRVLGAERSRWKLDEVDPNVGLFRQFSLIS